MLAVPDTGALLRFCASPSVATDLQEAKAALEAAGRYSELVALLQQRGRHAEALQLLQLLSCHPARLSVPPSGAAADLQGLPGVWAAVKYVAACPPGGLDSQVVDAHAPWILAADPEAGLEMFLQVRRGQHGEDASVCGRGALCRARHARPSPHLMQQTKPPTPPEAVLPVLSAAAPQLRATYLEAALQAGSADPARYDTQLALLYVQQLLAADAGAAEGKGARGCVRGRDGVVLRCFVSERQCSASCDGDGAPQGLSSSARQQRLVRACMNCCCRAATLTRKACCPRYCYDSGVY